MLSRLGSRLTLIPEVDRGRVRILPLGLALPELHGLVLSVAVGDRTIVFPQPSGKLPQGIRQTTGPSRISYRIPVAGGAVVYELWSPFAFADLTWRSAPVMFVRVGIDADEATSARLTVTLTQGARGESREGIARLVTDFPFSLEQAALGSPLRPNVAEHLRGSVPQDLDAGSLSVKGQGKLILGGRASEGWVLGSGALVLGLDIPAGGSAWRELALVFHTSSPVLEVDGSEQPFAYAATFKDGRDVLSRALDSRGKLGEWDRADIEALAIPSTPPELLPLASLGIQSFLANTWLVRGAGDAPYRYSEWEGTPRFHSTMDVTYNNAPFYVFFAPDLLRDLLSHWPAYSDGGDMPHDFGQHLIIGRTVYPIHMSVEENASFLLLHFVYENFTGDAALCRAQSPLLEKLARSLLASDEDGDGLPDRGVTNTFDDAPRYLNVTKNQTYLGVKAAAALEAYLKMPLPIPADLKSAIEARLDKVGATMESWWLGDHYPVALGMEMERRVLSPYVGPKPQTDAIGPSNYVAHGLVPLLLAGEAPMRYAHLAEHLESSHQRTATPFGDAHGPSQPNVWISQNLWRDLAAFYLGARLDPNDLVPRYWALQREACRRKVTDPRWEPFADSSENVYLSSYAREACVTAWNWARHRISFSRRSCRLSIGAPPGPGRLPLPFLRRNGRTPVLVWDLPEGPPARIENGDLLEGIRVEVGPSDPALFVESFYAFHFARDMGFSPAEVKASEPWLDPSLLALLRLAADKPSDPGEEQLIDRDPFTDSQDEPYGFRVRGVARDGDHTVVTARMVFDGAEHEVRIVLSEPRSRAYRIWDVISGDGTEQRSLRALLAY